jgi:hypothetical protein
MNNIRASTPHAQPQQSLLARFLGSEALADAKQHEWRVRERLRDMALLSRDLRQLDALEDPGRELRVLRRQVAQLRAEVPGLAAAAARQVIATELPPAMDYLRRTSRNGEDAG